MKAVRYHEFGPPRVLRVEEAPDAHAPPGAVRICTQAVSVNPIDWKLRSGQSQDVIPLRFPVIPGRDAVGVVDEIGDGVQGVCLGEVVFGLGGIQDTYAAYAILTAWAKPPTNWTVAQAASAGLAAATAIRALEALDALGPLGGRTLLIEGAAGAVGAAIAAFALDLGAVVIGTARPSNHAFLSGLGVTALEYGPGLADRVSSLAPGGAHAAIDTASSGSLGDLVTIVGGPERVVTVADFERAPRLGVTIASGANEPRLMAAAAELGGRGGFTPRVAHEMPVSEVVAAHELAERGSSAGKIVLVDF